MVLNICRTMTDLSLLSFVVAIDGGVGFMDEATGGSTSP